MRVSSRVKVLPSPTLDQSIFFRWCESNMVTRFRWQITRRRFEVVTKLAVGVYVFDMFQVFSLGYPLNLELADLSPRRSEFWHVSCFSSGLAHPTPKSKIAAPHHPWGNVRGTWKNVWCWDARPKSEFSNPSSLEAYILSETTKEYAKRWRNMWIIWREMWKYENNIKRNVKICE